MKKIDLWLLDLALSAASFLLAYRVRLLFELSGRTLMSFSVYAPTLVVLIPVWSIVLPVCGIYSQKKHRHVRLALAVTAAWCITVAAETALISRQTFVYWGSSKLILVLMLAIDYGSLLSYRLLLERRDALRETT